MTWIRDCNPPRFKPFGELGTPRSLHESSPLAPLKSKEHAPSWSTAGHLSAVIRVPADAATAQRPCTSHRSRVVQVRGSSADALRACARFCVVAEGWGTEISRPARPAVCGARRWPLEGVTCSSDISAAVCGAAAPYAGGGDLTSRRCSRSVFSFWAWPRRRRRRRRRRPWPRPFHRRRRARRLVPERRPARAARPGSRPTSRPSRLLCELQRWGSYALLPVKA